MLRQSLSFSPILFTDKISDQVFPWAKYREFPEKYVKFLCKSLLMDRHTGWLTHYARTAKSPFDARIHISCWQKLWWNVEVMLESLVITIIHCITAFVKPELLLPYDTRKCMCRLKFVMKSVNASISHFTWFALPFQFTHPLETIRELSCILIVDKKLMTMWACWGS